MHPLHRVDCPVKCPVQQRSPQFGRRAVTPSRRAFRLASNNVTELDSSAASLASAGVPGGLAWLQVPQALATAPAGHAVECRAVRVLGAPQRLVCLIAADAELDLGCVAHLVQVPLRCAHGYLHVSVRSECDDEWRA